MHTHRQLGMHNGPNKVASALWLTNKPALYEGRKEGPLLTNKDISLQEGDLYSSCMRSSMLHGSETLPVGNENEVALNSVQG